MIITITWKETIYQVECEVICTDTPNGVRFKARVRCVGADITTVECDSVNGMRRIAEDWIKVARKLGAQV